MHGVIELQAMPKSSGVPVVPGPGPCHRENGRTTGARGRSSSEVELNISAAKFGVWKCTES